IRNATDGSTSCLIFVHLDKQWRQDLERWVLLITPEDLVTLLRLRWSPAAAILIDHTFGEQHPSKHGVGKVTPEALQCERLFLSWLDCSIPFPFVHKRPASILDGHQVVKIDKDTSSRLRTRVLQSDAECSRRVPKICGYDLEGAGTLLWLIDGVFGHH